jgi:hypothetical protein
MRSLIIASLLALGMVGSTARAADPDGWIDLMPGKDLKGWKRVVLPADAKYNPEKKNPWKVDEQNKTLICDGVGIKELFLYDKPLGDGIFHVEWRFQKTADKVGYNSGIYFRCSPDGKVWHQAQVAHLEKPPFLGDIFADVPADGEVKRVIISGKGSELAKGPGEWNTCDITMKGKDVTVAVNGEVATRWNDCRVTSGLLGVQAEFYVIEFRNLKFKALK